MATSKREEKEPGFSVLSMSEDDPDQKQEQIGTWILHASFKIQKLVSTQTLVIALTRCIVLETLQTFWNLNSLVVFRIRTSELNLLVVARTETTACSKKVSKLQNSKTCVHTNASNNFCKLVPTHLLVKRASFKNSQSQKLVSTQTLVITFSS